MASRRRFLQSVLAAPLAAAALPRGLRALALLPQGQADVTFTNPGLIRYDSHCFTIGNKDAFIYGAEFHYSRCPQALWRDRLMKLKLAGYNTINSYVFWNYHEPVEGHADLSEFEAFVALIKEMGFWMIARPGPYVCAEWDAGGFPHWIIARQFPLRTNNPESIRTSEYWYKQVMPVLQRNQVTLGGPIIMVQVENEYDFSPPMPDDDKRAYITALAQAAWNQGIDVPLITCWTKQARENSDYAMSQIMDTFNIYSRWKITEQLPPRIAKLRAEEPASPLAITELQGGWFSKVGGKLSVEQEGVSGAQYNQIAKTAIEQGVTSFSTYMGFGGTNFDWAAKDLTTTYDYAAPLREPGGLWEKYYAARGIGATLGALGTVLTRAKKTESGIECSNPNVSVTLRENGNSGAIFLRENSNAEQRYKATFPDPNSPTRRPISIPRQGELVLGAREMKMIPVQIEIPGGALRYSTAELLATGKSQERQFLILYDEPGRVIELGLATRDEPHILGDTVYQYWDPEFESVVAGLRVEKSPQLFMLNNHILIFLLPREMALKSWTAEFPQQIIPGPFVGKNEKETPLAVPFVTDAAMIGETSSHKHTLHADLYFASGEHDLTLMLPPVPGKCRVDGAETDFKYDREWHTAQTHLSTPAIPVSGTVPANLKTWTERFDTRSGSWSQGALRPLEEMGPIPYGYVKYRAEFAAQDASSKMFISAFADDGKKVFINGKLAGDASVAKTEIEFPLSNFAQAGTNTLEISYELFGSPNGGKELGELKGIKSVRVGADAQSAKPIENWQVQRFAAPMRGRELDPQFSVREWKPAEISPVSSGAGLFPAFTWCRAEFSLQSPPAEWQVPWKLLFEADRDALLYLNGKFLGRYSTTGPQKEFFMPEPYLSFDAKSSNALTIVLAYCADANHIRTLRVEPYGEYALRRTEIEFEW